MIKKLLFSIIMAGMAFTAMAKLADLPTRNINGKTYYVYQVQPGEGELAIAKKLGINVSEISKHNPSVAKGLKAYQELIFPAQTDNAKSSKSAEKQTAATKTQAKRHIGTYTAKQGESLYGISKKFDMDQDEFIRLNPHAAGMIRAGETYRVYDDKTPVEESVAQKVEHAFSNPSAGNGNDTEKSGTTYLVKDHDTFYGIAHANGLTIEQLQAANPGVNILKSGESIYIPAPVEELKKEATTIVSYESPVVLPNTIVEVEKPKAITIAIALPFNAGNAEKAKASKKYADFYRGFMLGIDSLKNCGTPIHILAFDTENSDAKVKEILANEKIGESQIIIAPDDASHLALVAEYGREKGINVLNPFSVRDTLYKSSAQLMQMNIPSEVMIERAVSHFASNVEASKVVVVSVANAKDKADIASQIVAAYMANGIPSTEIKVAEKLTEADLAKLGKQNDVVFIPTSSKINVADAILPAIIKYRESLNGLKNTSVIGYPEWITFKGKTQSNMKNANTYIYSRFYVPSHEEASTVEKKHVKWYGYEMPAGAPRQAIMGYDTALYLVNALQINGGDFTSVSPVYDGLQNSVHFMRVPEPDGGWVNDSMNIINYRPSGSIEKTTL